MNMYDGFVRVAAAAPKIKVADCDYNADRIIERMAQAGAEKVHLLCLPELCITGSTCGDLFLQPTLINSAKEALGKIVAAGKDMDMVVVVGLPLVYETRLYNVAAVFLRGQILGYVQKAAKTTEKYFAKADNIPGKHEGADIGVDLFFACETDERFVFKVELGDDLPLAGGAPVVANISAKAAVMGGSKFNRDLAVWQSAQGVCGYVYANAGFGESSTDKVYPGHHLIAENGTLLAESPPFATLGDTLGNGLAISEIDLGGLAHIRTQQEAYAATAQWDTWVPFALKPACTTLKRKISPVPFVENSFPEEALAIQAAGLAKRLSHTNGRAVIGVSGGLDSCLALLVTAKAYEMLGKPLSDIVAVTMPGFGTTAHTKNNALALCKALGIPCRDIDITAAVTRHLQDIDHPPGCYDVVFENAQARMRTYVLMDLANQVNGQVIGTGSLSELALGWATYNGDHMSMYAVNAGVPKTLVRHIIGHVSLISGNSALKTVLGSILATPVSPELLPANNGKISQITEDLVGPYELHDFFICHTLRFGRGPRAVFTLAKLAFNGKYTGAEILHWQKTFYRRFFSQQFKRSCLPDGPQVVDISLSPRAGFHMPSDASAEVWLRELACIEQLGV